MASERTVETVIFRDVERVYKGQADDSSFEDDQQGV